VQEADTYAPKVLLLTGVTGANTTAHNSTFKISSYCAVLHYILITLVLDICILYASQKNGFTLISGKM